MSGPLSRRRFLVGSAAAGVAASAGGVPGRARAEPTSQEEPGAFEDLESFVDDAIAADLEEYDASGAVVSVVHGGEIALTNGYGETSFGGAPIDPEVTPIHTGSVSKLFTYTAAMRLIEEGAIDPDEDVTDYLESVSIPDTDDDPITLSHLATHSAGFEIRSRHDTVSDPADREPLEDAVGKRPPNRVYPPGERFGYTNYAASLTGQLVADVSGSSFEASVAESVLEPLGMDRSTFDVVPDQFDAETRGAYLDEAQWLSNVPPASGLWSTGEEMAEFVLAHLEGGATDEGRILSAEATEEMHRQWFTVHEELDGMAFGFVERTRGDVRLLGHTGEGTGYGSSLVLVPELDLGLFVAFQGDATGAPTSSFEDEFLDRYVPEPDRELTPDGRPERADDLVGTYRQFAGATQTTYEKTLFTALTPDLEVRVEDDGTLVTDGHSVQRWVEIEPLVYRRIDGGQSLVFHEEDGEIVAFTLEGSIGPYTSISWYEKGVVQAGATLVSTLVVLSGLVGWPLAAAVRRYRGTSSAGSDSPGPRRARWAAGTAGGLLFGFVVAFLALFILLDALGRPTVFDVPPRGFGLLFALPLGAAIATLVSAGYAVQAWHEEFWRLPGRVHYTAVVVALAVLLWVYRYWNLLGFTV
ncbi:serine hydrolase domain-containing protein [Natrarchaeobius sp. A-rgal3]|uniref:serine hydrolase domain-containing protein n=1 Tax=Natrarchaeobius versutus TaxID=1679078 RepID=UPI00350E9B70